jgi:hypothetical protein
MMSNASTCRVGRCGAVVWAMLLALAPAALAQTSPRPYRSLFGGASSGTERETNWFMLTATEAYDQNVLGELNQPLQPVFQKGGPFTELTGEMNYRATTSRLQLSTTGAANFRYYPSQDQLVGVGHHVGLGATIKLSPSTSFTVNQTAAYSPSYLYRLFTDIAAPQLGQVSVGSNYAVNDVASYNYGTNVSVTSQVAPRTTLVVHAGGQYTDFVHAAQSSTSAGLFRNLFMYEAGAVLVRGITRDLRFTAGYNFRRAEYLDGTFPSEHDVNIGFEYQHLLSRTRRTALRVNSGSVMLDAPAPGDSVAVLRSQYRMTGDVALQSQFGRTWQVEGGYRRGVSFIEGIQTPVLTDGVTSTASGMLSPRINLLTTAAYSVGQPTISNTAHGITTYTADARTTFAIRHTWAFFAEYLYYFYDFSSGIVPIGAPPRVGRNSVRAGLMLWAPMRHR